MCQKRTRKIKKGSLITRMREARRMQRIQHMTSPPSDDSNSQPAPQQSAEKTAQSRLLLELAWKTVALMHKNRLIQQKIVALQKETSEFVAAVMSNPENRKRYLEHVRIYNLLKEKKAQEKLAQEKLAQEKQAQKMAENNNNDIPMNVDPK